MPELTYQEHIAHVRECFSEQSSFSTLVNEWIDELELSLEFYPEEQRQSIATHHLDEFYTLMRKK